MEEIINQVAQHAGKTEEFNHPFFLRVRDMVAAEDEEGMIREKIALKLLRLTESTQDGFLLVDYPNVLEQAEMLEEYRGGLNGFIHLTLPDEVLVDIEASKMKCNNCGRVYYKNDVINEEHNIRINGYMPADGHCDDCGSTDIEIGSDPVDFEKQLEAYKEHKDELLSFYNHFGLLIDYEIRHGYESFDKLKRQIQYNIKH